MIPALLGLLSASAQAAPVSAEVFLKGAVDDTLAVAYAAEGKGTLPERIRPTLERFFSFESLTRRAVGPGWRSFKPEEQKRTIELFSTLIIRTYSERFDPAVRPEISFGPEVQLERGRREVSSTIRYDGSNYNVTYRLEPDGESWRVFDVIIEGVSMVLNYRSQFESLQNRGGAEAVIRSIEQNLRADAKK
jgi:phospholipid transport system substrate-binding protein